MNTVLFHSTINIFLRSLIFLQFFIQFLFGNTPNPLQDQRQNNKSIILKPYRQAESSYIHYVYGQDGDKTVSVNFNRYGTLISKTTYILKNKRKSFIYNDDCKKKECQQFIH